MFPCEHCGKCCRSIGKISLLKNMALDDGVCRFLNKDKNLCEIYDRRPLLCNVDGYYDKYMTDTMTREEFYALNKNVCLSLQRPSL